MTDQKSVPTHTTDLINDAGFITESKFKWENLSGKPVLANVATSGSFVDLADKPKLSQLENDCNFPADGKVLWENVQGKPKFFSGNYLELENRPVVFSGSYTDLIDKPVLFSGSYVDLVDTPVLFDGNYNSLTNKPVLFSGMYKDLIGVPALFSGKYDDLINAPVLFSGDYNDLENKPVLFSGDYNDLINAPLVFSGDFVDLDNIPPIVSKAWSSEQVKYSIGDYVVFDGNAYCCIADNDSMPTENEKFWKRVSKGIELPVMPEQISVIKETEQIVVNTTKLAVQELTQLSMANMILDPSKITGDILTVFPTNDRTIMLPPATSETAGLRYIIRNRSLDSEITLKLQETQSVMIVIIPGSYAEIVCDGYSWFTLN